MKTETTIIARRSTFDGISVVLWSDGLVTGRIGERVCGVRLPAACAFRAADDFGLYTWAELRAFVRRVAKAGAVPHAVIPAEAASRAALARQVRRHVCVRAGVISPVNPR